MVKFLSRKQNHEGETLEFETGNVTDASHDIPEFRKPTPDEELTLRRIPYQMKWYVYLICLVEFAERASYYGTQDRFSYFYGKPLPEGGNGAGAPDPNDPNGQVGALDRGLAVATAIQLTFKFLSYALPIYTAYLSDRHFGRIKLIWWGVWAGLIAHIFFVVAAIPKILTKSDVAMGLSMVGMISLALGTAMIKPCLLPLLLEQYPHQTDVVTELDSGELVILDKDASLQRMTMTFYWAINIGAFLSVATTYAAQRVGYWLAFLIPTIVYMMMPVTMILLAPKITDSPPAGYSIVAECLKVIKVCFESGWISRLRQNTFWAYALPTNLSAQGRIGWRKNKPGFYEESLVDDVRLTLSACLIFAYYIIYNFNDNQLGPVINYQTSAMTAEGVPQDLVSNFNSLSIIIMMPLLDYLVYPFLRKNNITFRPVHRIFLGFMLAAGSTFAGAIIQWRVYETSPCGYYASDCIIDGKNAVSPLSLWIVSIEYWLQGASECLAMTTGYEIAFERSPDNMRALVLSLFLFTIAISSAISQAITPSLKDPHLIIPFAVFAGLGAVSALSFLWRYRNLHLVMEEERRERELLLGDLIEQSSEGSTFLNNKQFALKETNDRSPEQKKDISTQ